MCTHIDYRYCRYCLCFYILLYVSLLLTRFLLDLVLITYWGRREQAIREEATFSLPVTAMEFTAYARSLHRGFYIAWLLLLLLMFDLFMTLVENKLDLI